MSNENAIEVQYSVSRIMMKTSRLYTKSPSDGCALRCKQTFVVLKCLMFQTRFVVSFQVFDSLKLTAYDLSVDMLDVHAVSLLAYVQIIPLRLFRHILKHSQLQLILRSVRGIFLDMCYVFVFLYI